MIVLIGVKEIDTHNDKRKTTNNSEEDPPPTRVGVWPKQGDSKRREENEYNVTQEQNYIQQQRTTANFIPKFFLFNRYLELYVLLFQIKRISAMCNSSMSKVF